MGCLKRLLWGICGISTAVLALVVILHENRQLPYADYFFSQAARCPHASLSLIVLAALVLLFAAVICLYALFSPGKKTRLIDKSEDGIIVISRAALEHSVKNSIERIGNLSCEKVRVHIIQRRIPRLEVKVRIVVSGAKQLADLARELQEHIKLSLEHFSGYQVSKVKVDLLDAADVSGSAADE